MLAARGPRFSRSRAHDRPDRAPLVRFVSPAAHGGHAAILSGGCRPPDRSRSGVGQPAAAARRSTGSRDGLGRFALAVFRPAISEPARIVLTIHRLVCRRRPRGSCIAGSPRRDVPLPAVRVCVAWSGGLARRPTALVGFCVPFAVLLLPAGRRTFPSARSHLPFPERPPRCLLVEGPAARVANVCLTNHPLYFATASRSRTFSAAPGLCSRGQSVRRRQRCAAGPILPWASSSLRFSCVR